MAQGRWTGRAWFCGIAVASVALGMAASAPAARPAAVKKTRCFTTSAGDRICLKYECRGSRCVKTHRRDRPRGARRMLCTPVAGHTSSNGRGCSQAFPPYYYHRLSWNSADQEGNDPYHIVFSVEKHEPGPDGYVYRLRFSWQGKHGAAICLAKIKVTGDRYVVQCSAGPCDANLPSIKGDGYFDVLAKPKRPDETQSQAYEIIIRGA